MKMQRVLANFLAAVRKRTDSLTGGFILSYFTVNTAVESITFTVLLYDITEATHSQAKQVKLAKTSGKLTK